MSNSIWPKRGLSEFWKNTLHMDVNAIDIEQWHRVRFLIQECGIESCREIVHLIL